MPKALVAFAWGSRSIKRVGRSEAANEAARFTAVVVFPTPPFWLTTATTRLDAGMDTRAIPLGSNDRANGYHNTHGLVDGRVASFHVERCEAVRSAGHGMRAIQRLRSGPPQGTR